LIAVAADGVVGVPGVGGVIEADIVVNFAGCLYTSGAERNICRVIVNLLIFVDNFTLSYCFM